MDSHRLNNGPLHGELVGQWKDLEQPRWQRLNLSRYRGHRTHLEFSAEAQGPCILLKVAQGPSPPADPWPDFAQLRQLLASEPEGIEQLAARYQDLCRGAVTRLAAAESSQENFTSTQAALADWLVRHEDLLVDPQAEVSEQLRATVKKYLARLADLKGQIKPASRLCMAMMDGSAEDEQLLIRGNYKTPGERVPRRLLEALDGCPPPSDQRGSGRLQLARQIASPDNPLTARVAVNRIWHHLFGRGLVASVDNFGVLGERPSHPALLDHLARRFLAGQWSQKKLIREIVLSETYQMAAVSWSPAGRRIDPANHLLHRMRVRRMEGEVLRDWILAVSGRLDRRMFGPSVPVQLTAFMQGRGRPRQQGPLDGDGRRSIYIAVRRNFLSPMMLAFDTPIPFTTIGRRNVSNVPAQALILILRGQRQLPWSAAGHRAGAEVVAKIGKAGATISGRARPADVSCSAGACRPK